MKKFIIGMALAVASSASMAATTNVCNGSGQKVADVAGGTDGTTFVRVTFSPTCGGNTVLSYDQDTGKLWAAAASVKGSNVFGGSTNGGSVGVVRACRPAGTTGAGGACGNVTDTTGFVSAGMATAETLGVTN